MRKAILSLLIFGAVLSAETVPVTFVSADPVVTVPGIDGGYAEAGPYTLNVNGTLLPAMCMDDFRGVGGTWNAAVTPVNSNDLSNTVLGNGSFAFGNLTVSNSQVYKMEAYLFSEITQPGADRSDLQLAAWALMEVPYDLENGSPFATQAVSEIINSNNSTAVNDVLGAYSAVNSGFGGAGYQILSDVNGTNQEFIVATPEPSTYMLLGSGLLLAGALRFSRRKKTTTISV